MRFHWQHIYRRTTYQRGRAYHRRLVDIQYSCARALRRARGRFQVRQADLARWVGTSQASISRIECASPKASFDVFLRAMIALEAPDDEIAAAFNAGARRDVVTLRERVNRPLSPLPEKRGAPPWAEGLPRTGHRS
jgi:transcriptional regulator with XRE-family HTH domain